MLKIPRGDQSVDLSIIIVSWNTRDLLEACLDSVWRGIEASRDLVIEVFVVDNASTDGTVSMLKEGYPWIRLKVNDLNVGFARANNQALKLALGQYLLLLNSDTELKPDTLDELVRIMVENPKIGAVGPRLVNNDGSLQAGCHPMLTPSREFWRLLYLDRLWPRASYPFASWGNNIPRRVEVIKGACLFLRRAALNQTGLLDERYFMYTEEMDLCYRLAQAGWQLWYVPWTFVIHHGGASSIKTADEMYVQLYRSKVLFHRKIGGRKRALYFKILLMLAYLPRVLLDPANSTFRALVYELPRM